MSSHLLIDPPSLAVTPSAIPVPAPASREPASGKPVSYTHLTLPTKA